MLNQIHLSNTILKENLQNLQSVVEKALNLYECFLAILKLSQFLTKWKEKLSLWLHNFAKPRLSQFLFSFLINIVNLKSIK